MDKIDYKKKLMQCYEQDLEIIVSNLKERLFFLQSLYYKHHSEDIERTKIRNKIDKIDNQLIYLKKIIDLQITYKGDLHDAILSRL